MVKLYSKYYIENYERLKEKYRKKYWANILAHNPRPEKYPFKFTKGKFIITFT